MALSRRRRKFASEYVKNGFNGVQAVFAAGYKQGYNSACTEAYRLLRNAEISKLVDDHIKSSKMSADEVIESLTDVAKSDVEIKGSEKLKALELLGKYHKLFPTKVEMTTNEVDETIEKAASKHNLPLDAQELESTM